jgi:putative sterol carrier protein
MAEQNPGAPTPDPRVEAYFVALPARIMARPEALGDMTATIKFNVKGAGIYRLVIDEGQVRVEKGDGKAQATVRIGVDDLLALTAGKANPMLLFATGKLQFNGDAGVAMRLNQFL